MKILSTSHIGLFARSLYYIIVAAVFINMGKGGEATNTIIDPLFTPLDDHEKSYYATIIDNGKPLEVKDVNFTGKTKLGGIKKENQHVTINIDLGNIKELIIKQRSYYSKNFSNQEFILVDYIQHDGTHVSNLLFPKQVIISAVGINPAEKYSCHLRDIEKIVFGQTQTQHTEAAQ